MDFVYDVDLVARRGGREHDLLLDHAHIVDSGVAGSVYLNDVQTAAFCYAPAVVALVARVCRGTVNAVERLCKKSCTCGLSDTSRSAEQIRMGDPALLDRVLQGGDDEFLTDQVLEFLRSFACSSHFVSHM